MDSKLELILAIDSFGRLQAKDNTAYPSEYDGNLDRMKETIVRPDGTSETKTTYKEDNENLLDFIKSCTPFNVRKDGKYTYHKIVYSSNGVEPKDPSQEGFAPWGEENGITPWGSLHGSVSILSYKQLQKCLEYYQLKSFEEISSGINPVTCRANNDISTIRDLLLSAVYLIEMYFSEENYDEALKIIEHFDKLCGLECGCNTKTTCGCNG